jgi:triacylglycerol lipase
MDEGMAANTRHLIAPELAAALERLPDFELTPEVLAVIRTVPLSAMPRAPLTPEQEAVACEERFIPGLRDALDVRVLIYTPPGGKRARPAIVHMHGGGFVMGAPELNDAHNRSIAGEHDCLIVSVDYRLAPDTRFPGAVEDGYAALAWLNENADALDIDRRRVAVAGESAGGGHAMALAVYARDRGEFPICLQLLDCPMLDDRTGSTSDPHPTCGEFVWTPAKNRFGWQALLGVEPGSADVPYGASIARVEDFSGLPPACITVGSLDLFAEECFDYARRLMRAGVPAELHLIPGAFHGYNVMGDEAPQVRQNAEWRRNALARAFGAATQTIL